MYSKEYVYKRFFFVLIIVWNEFMGYYSLY